MPLTFWPGSDQLSCRVFVRTTTFEQEGRQARLSWTRSGASMPARGAGEGGGEGAVHVCPCTQAQGCIGPCGCVLWPLPACIRAAPPPPHARSAPPPLPRAPRPFLIHARVHRLTPPPTPPHPCRRHSTRTRRRVPAGRPLPSTRTACQCRPAVMSGLRICARVCVRARGGGQT